MAALHHRYKAYFFSLVYVENDYMDSHWLLLNSIHLLNDFCAEMKSFSYERLTFLKLKELHLQVDTKLQELAMGVTSDENYHTLHKQLLSGQRLHQLLSIHFRKVHIVYEITNRTKVSSPPVLLETIELNSSTNTCDLRNANFLGARLRRALNVALQGHTCILWLHTDDDIEHLQKLWQRGRVTKLLEEHQINYNNDFAAKMIKLWQDRSPEEGEGIVITIE
ncbi:hypothetical protein QUF50_01215 [Thiotrichales bacterium HSG1]|nr:hypothetical protein [Thiotrichales bacterium HSG1]